jgi:Zn-dependent protease with chaperone function
MVHGDWFDAHSSAARPATLEWSAEGFWCLRCGETLLHLPPQAVQVSARIGSIPRRFDLQQAGEFETLDNDGVDTMLERFAPIATRGLVNRLERNWSVALVALVGVILCCAAIIRYGLPTLARWTAAVVPASADRALGERSLKIIDAGLLKPSTLEESRQAQLQERFEQMTRGIADGHEYRLELRSAPSIGPNAFALPSGIVVMTDDLVQLSQDDEELEAVLAHEIGHVRNRHALRQMIEAAGISLVAVAVLGDVSSVTALASSAPALLQARNSRQFEREADAVARQWLSEQHISQDRFDAMLCRLSAKTGAGSDGVGRYLESHPPVRERAQCKPEPDATTAQ